MFVKRFRNYETRYLVIHTASRSNFDSALYSALSGAAVPAAAVAAVAVRGRNGLSEQRRLALQSVFY